MNISGVVGFPHCKDPSMVPITIHVQDFVSSVEPQFFFSQYESYDADFRKNLTSKFGDLEGIRGNFNEFITWLNENGPDGWDFWSEDDLSYILSDPITPLLSLYCDQKNIISILMDKSMEDNSEIVMVENGAECTLIIENITDFSSQYWDESIWYFNYTIYHDKAMQVTIDKGFSFEEGTKQFIRIQDCFLDTIFGYGYDFQNIDYGDLMRKLNWIAEHDAGHQPCSSDFSIERYALSIMNMNMPLITLTSNSSDNSELWMNDDMHHCMWPRVECSQGFVVSLDLMKVEGLSGHINIPTEVGLLTELLSLELGKQLFLIILLLYFATKQILFLLLTLFNCLFTVYHDRSE